MKETANDTGLLEQIPIAEKIKLAARGHDVGPPDGAVAQALYPAPALKAAAEIKILDADQAFVKAPDGVESLPGAPEHPRAHPVAQDIRRRHQDAA